jgi:AcrR family transcriptional regulator
VTEPTRSRWRGVPADARTAERRAVLVDVAFDLLGTEGTAGTTVRKVCEAARLNPRYFYESFEDLDALLVAVFERTAEHVVQQVIAAVAPAAADGADDEEILRVAVLAAVRHVTEDPRRTRVLFMEGLSNEALGRRRFDSLHEMAGALADDARVRAQERAGAPVELTSIMVVAGNLMLGGFAELLMSFVSGRLDVSLEQLVEDTAALFRGLTDTVDALVDRQLGIEAMAADD